MKQTRYSIPLKILLLVLVLLLLTSCVFEEEDFDIKQKALLEQYPQLFQARATLQYGEEAKVVDIETEIRTGRDAVWPATHVSLSGNLLGTIQVGDEQFEALYLTEQDEIYSKRNADKIKQSAIQLFTDMGIDVVEMSLTDYFEKPLWLPDNLVDFKDLPENKYDISVNVLVKNDLSSLSVKDFIWLTEYNNDTYDANISFIQLNDMTEAAALYQQWENGDVYIFYGPTVYDHEREKEVNLFSRYDIGAYLYVDRNLQEDMEIFFEDKQAIIKANLNKSKVCFMKKAETLPTSMYQAFSELGMDVVVIDSNESLEKYPLTLRHYWKDGSVDFSTDSPDMCYEGNDPYKNVYEYFNLTASLYVEKLDDKVKIVYQDKDGIISEDTLE